MSEEYDCQSCGACCVNTPENRDEGYEDYVAVEPRDAILSQPELVRRYVLTNGEGERHLRLAPDGRCRALLGKLGCKVSCSIYHYRPRSCRRVEAGSELCRRYRRAHGIDH